MNTAAAELARPIHLPLLRQALEGLIPGDVLGFWARSGLPFCAVHPAPLVVRRGSGGAVLGFAALIAEYQVPVAVAAATSLHVGLKLMDQFETELRALGHTRWWFYTDEWSEPGFEQQVRRLAARGMFTELGARPGEQCVWWERRLCR